MAEPAPAPVAAEVVHDPAASVAESSTLAALETTGAADGVGPASVPSPAPSAAASEAPSAAPSASDAARARREARKAKILARGTDRLARITSAGRGSEGASLYAPSPGPSLASAHTADATSSPVVPSAEGEDAQGAPTAFSSDPPEATLGQVVPPRVGPEPNEDDPLQQFMRALQAQMGPDMGPGMGSEAGARSDAGTGAGSGSGSPFPPFPGAGAGAGAGAGPNTGPGAGGQEDPFAAMMAQMQAMSGGPGTAAAATAPAPRTWVDYLLTWVHFLAIVAFALFTFGAAFTAHWHPASAPLTAQTFEHPPRSILNAWGRLARAPPDAADLGAFNLGAHMPLQQFVRINPSPRLHMWQIVLTDVPSRCFRSSSRWRSCCNQAGCGGCEGNARLRDWCAPLRRKFQSQPCKSSSGRVRSTGPLSRHFSTILPCSCSFSAPRSSLPAGDRCTSPNPDVEQRSGPRCAPHAQLSGSHHWLPP